MIYSISIGRVGQVINISGASLFLSIAPVPELYIIANEQFIKCDDLAVKHIENDFLGRYDQMSERDIFYFEDWKFNKFMVQLKKHRYQS